MKLTQGTQLAFKDRYNDLHPFTLDKMAIAQGTGLIVCQMHNRVQESRIELLSTTLQAAERYNKQREHR